MWHRMFPTSLTARRIPFGSLPLHDIFKRCADSFSAHCYRDPVHTSYIRFAPNFFVKLVRSNSGRVHLHSCRRCFIHGISYALQLLVRLLLSFHFDDCILIPISFSDQIRIYIRTSLSKTFSCAAQQLIGIRCTFLCCDRFGAHPFERLSHSIHVNRCRIIKRPCKIHHFIIDF